MFEHYEIVAIVIRKVMIKITQAAALVEEGLMEELSSGQKVTNYELTLTLF